MTASVTPRLGLMSPVPADPFLVQDFAALTQKLDAQPGIIPVPNQNSRPTNWGVAQHGSTVLQTDLGILWYWNQPSSTTAGSWQRVMGKGSCGTWQNPSSCSTQITEPNNGVKACETEPIKVGGGRPLVIDILWDIFGNDYGKCMLNLWCNNIRIKDFPWHGRRNPDHSGGSFSCPHNPAPVYQATLKYHLTICSVKGYPPNGGGLTIIQNLSLSIRET
jgi:hypothetical protein